MCLRGEGRTAGEPCYLYTMSTCKIENSKLSEDAKSDARVLPTKWSALASDIDSFQENFKTLINFLHLTNGPNFDRNFPRCSGL